jgi:hypothetical protein
MKNNRGLASLRCPTYRLRPVSSARHSRLVRMQRDEEAALVATRCHSSKKTRTSREAHLETEPSAYHRSDSIMIGVLSLLIIATLVLTAFRDIRGPDTSLCEGVESSISKHLHCVSRNETRSFSQFLAEQGAKKQHPNYVAERARIHSRKGHGPPPLAADADRPNTENAGGLVARLLSIRSYSSPHVAR